MLYSTDHEAVERRRVGAHAFQHLDSVGVLPDCAFLRAYRTHGQ
jgi:hypothetical protein